MIELGDRGLRRADYERVVIEGERVTIAASALERVERMRARMLEHIAGGGEAYGVTTGLGLLADVGIAPDEQGMLQRSLLTARAAGLGPPLAAETVRGAMLLRLTGFLHGNAGVSVELCRFLADRLNDGWSPVVPDGPYGAAGEIGALAHLFQTLIGEGSVVSEGTEMPAAEALRTRGTAPYDPLPKEGLALVNGSPFATALGIGHTGRARGLVATATVTGALGIAVTGAGARATVPRLGELANDEFVTRVQRELALLLADEDVWGERGQPPISMRVLPQVNGAAFRAIDSLDNVLDGRLRGTSDSPVYLEADERHARGLYPSGAFHAIDVAAGLESVGIACCHVVNLVEKRLHRLLDCRFSGLPHQLTTRPGAQAGVVALHKTAVGLAAEARTLANPASVHCLDTSGGQEDVQTLTFLVAARVGRLLDALESALACELVALRQAAHLAVTRPAGEPLSRIVGIVAAEVPPVDVDRSLAADVTRVRGLIGSGAIRP